MHQVGLMLLLPAAAVAPLPAAPAPVPAAALAAVVAAPADPGAAAGLEARFAQFTPVCVVDGSRCLARTWGGGAGWTVPKQALW